MLTRLEAAGLRAVGAGPNEAAARTPVFVEHNGLRIGFLAYVDVPVEGRSGFDTRTWIAGAETPGLAWADPELVAQDVATAVPQADLVVVLLHFGLEGRLEVTAAQQRVARAAIDAGATLVLGAHAHVLQPVEQYGNGLIVYNLGNFVFDGFTQTSNYTAIFSAKLTPEGIEEYSFIPAMIESGVPRPASEAEAEVIFGRLTGGG
jgi:poly-gamma-glutamate synthesis protein (capsule biosynthesis protein)